MIVVFNATADQTASSGKLSQQPALRGKVLCILLNIELRTQINYHQKLSIKILNFEQQFQKQYINSS